MSQAQSNMYLDYMKDVLSGRIKGISELIGFIEYFSVFANSKIVGKRLFDSISQELMDPIGKAVVDLFLEGLEQDLKCDDVMKMCEITDGELNLRGRNIGDDGLICLKKYVFPVVKYDLRELILSSN